MVQLTPHGFREICEADLDLSRVAPAESSALRGDGELPGILTVDPFPLLLPYHSTLKWCRSSGISQRRHTFSSMRRFAWCPTKWKLRAGSQCSSRVAR